MENIRILYLEDNLGDLERIREKLESTDFNFEITLVQIFDEFDKALHQNKYDLFLAHYNLPGCDGISALRLAKEYCPDIPFIFISSVMGEDAVIKALIEGATDYVHKQKLSRLLPAAKRALEKANNHRQHKLAEADHLTIQLRQTLEGLEQEIAERVQAELVQSALYRITDETHIAEDFPTFYATLHEIVGELMCARNFYIALYDEATQMLSFPFYVDDVDQPPLPKIMGNGLTEYVIRNGKAALIHPEMFTELLGKGEIQIVGTPAVDWLGVPLKADERVLGVLAVQSYTPDVRFDDKDKELLTFVSQHIAIAIERRRAQSELRHYQEHLEELVKMRTTELTQANISLQQEITERVKAELIQSALYRITDEANSTDDLQVFYAAIHQIVSELMYARNFYIALYDETNQMLSFPYFVDEIDEPYQNDASKGMAGYVLRTNQPTLIHPERYTELLEQGEIEIIGTTPVDWLGVPLKVEDLTLGVLVVQSYTPDFRFDEKDKELLTFVSQHIATAIERRRGQSELRHYQEHLEELVEVRTAALKVLTDIGWALAATLDPQSLYEIIATQTARVMFADNIYIALYHPDTDELEFSLDNLPNVPRGGRRRKVANGLTEYIIRTRQPLFLQGDTNQQAADLGIQPVLVGPMAIAWIGVPMLSSERVLGVLAVQHFTDPQAYNESHVELLQSFANQAAIVLENTRLYAAAQQEILERKKVMEALEESEARYIDLYDNAPDMYVSVDVKTDLIEQCNQTLANNLGYFKGEILGRTIFEMYHPDCTQDAQMVFSLFLKTGEIQDAELQLMRKNGTKLDVSLNVSAVRDDNGNILYSRSTWRDITKRVQAEKELRRHRDHLEELVAERTVELEAHNQELEAFSYSVSHDLRAPLRIINGFSKIILDDYADKLDAEGRHFLNSICANTEKMSQLIDDLLTFSRLSRQEMSLSDIKMETLVQSVWDELKSINPGREIKFSVNELPPTKGDGPMIRQVWVNLLSNAIKFTIPRKIALIEIGSNFTESDIIYYIKDNGVGFDVKYTNKLFGVFQRLHRDNEFEGLGIGLALVQRIVLRHRGRVWAEGKVDEGATFYFSIPRVSCKNLD